MKDGVDLIVLVSMQVLRVSLAYAIGYGAAVPQPGFGSESGGAFSSRRM
jgi:hypothetical protein